MSDENDIQAATDETPAAPAAEAAAPRRVKRYRSDEPKIDAPPPPVVFRSSIREPYEFAVMDVLAMRDAAGHLIWEVPAADAERFARHIFVKSGRIVQAEV